MNTTHPLLPDYTGPTQGWFTFLHHEVPIEWSDNVLERRDYVWKEKPPREQRVRALACQVIPAALTPALDTARDAYATARTALDTAWTTLDTTWAAYNTARDAYATARDAYHTAWLCEHLPATPWRTLYEHLPATPWRTLYDEEERMLIYDALEEAQP